LCLRFGSHASGRSSNPRLRHSRILGTQGILLSPDCDVLLLSSHISGRSSQICGRCDIRVDEVNLYLPSFAVFDWCDYRLHYTFPTVKSTYIFPLTGVARRSPHRKAMSYTHSVVCFSQNRSSSSKV